MLSDIRYILWDLDGTLYRFEQDFLVACNLAAARAAIHLGVPLQMDEAIDFAWNSHARTGQSILHFLSDYGLDKQDMHDCYHGFIDETIINASEAVIDKLEMVINEHSISNLIITHASRSWAHRVLKHLGLDRFFEDSNIIAKEDYDFQSKCESVVPFEMGVRVLNAEKSQTIVIEDTVKNLKTARQYGLKTALLHHAKPPQPMPDYVDFDYNNAVEFLDALAQQH